jgi:hypothetical protein
LAAIVFSAFAPLKIIDEVFGGSKLAKKFTRNFKRFNLNPSFGRAYEWSIDIVSKVYGSRLISFRALIVSMCVSVSWMLAILLLVYFYEGKGAWFFNGPFSGVVIHRFWWLFFISLLIDFLSCCLTRALLPMAISSSSITKFLILILDLFLSVILFYVLFTFAKYSFLPSAKPDGVIDTIGDWFTTIPNLNLVMQLLTDATIIPLGGGEFKIENGNMEAIYAFPEGLVFLSSLLTSFWILLHIFTFYLLKLANNFDWIKKILVDSARIREKPFLSMGAIIYFALFIPMLIIWIIFYRLKIYLAGG